MSEIKARPFRGIPAGALRADVTCDGSEVASAPIVTARQEPYLYSISVRPAAGNTWESILRSCLGEARSDRIALLSHWSPCAPVRRKVIDESLRSGLKSEEAVVVEFERHWWQHGPDNSLSIALVLSEGSVAARDQGIATKRGSILWEAPHRRRPGRGDLYGLRIAMREMGSDGGPGRVEWDGIGFRITLNSSLSSSQTDPRPAIAVLLEDLVKEAAAKVAEKRMISGEETDEHTERLQSILDMEVNGVRLEDLVADEAEGSSSLRQWCWQKAHQLRSTQDLRA